MCELEAVILAGGRSSRMGRDKALLPFGGYETLAEYQYRRLLPHFSRVSISAKSDKFPFDAPLILDEESPKHSPMVALASILRRPRSDGVFLLAVDMPGVDPGILQALQEEFCNAGDTEIVVARSPHGVEPLCGIYRPELLPRVEALLRAGTHRLQSLLERAKTREVPFDDPAPFVNLNRPQEYQRASGVV